MKHLIAIGILLATLLVANTTFVSATTLWDFVIDAKFVKSEISPYEKPVILGTVLDHASKPISNADITIKFAGKSAATTTNSSGSFKYEFDEQQTPGTFAVIISAKLGDKKGFATLDLKVGKEESTFNEIYYNSDDFGNRTKTLPGTAYDGLQLKQYLKYLEEQNKRKQKQFDVEAQRSVIHEIQVQAQRKLQEDLNSRPVGPGIFSDTDTQRYLSTLNPKVKDSISAQLNYTKQIYEEARGAMKTILDNGGSLKDAKKAYFDKLAVTKDQLNNMNNFNNTENHSKIKTNDDKKINSKKVKGLSVNKNLK